MEVDRVGVAVEVVNHSLAGHGAGEVSGAVGDVDRVVPATQVAPQQQVAVAADRPVEVQCDPTMPLVVLVGELALDVTAADALIEVERVEQLRGSGKPGLGPAE